MNTKEEVCKHAEDFLRFLFPNNEIFELRAIKANKWIGKEDSPKATYAGWYKDPEKAAKDIVELCWQRKPAACYVTLNACPAELYYKSSEELNPGLTTTQDKDIQQHTMLLIDIDPIRPSGVSSTHEELLAAADKLKEIWDRLTELGWPEPCRTMSGNGTGLLYPLDLGDLQIEEQTELKQRVLQALATEFNDEKVEVDTTTFNASRITKVMGTMARKGSDGRGHADEGIPDRPHRRAECRLPAERKTCSQLDLENAILEFTPELEEDDDSFNFGLENQAAVAERKRSADNNNDGWLERKIEEHKIPVGSPIPYQGGVKYKFHQLPKPCERHAGGGHDLDSAPFLIQRADGTIQAGCRHAGCTWDWEDLKKDYGIVTRDVPQPMTDEDFEILAESGEKGQVSNYVGSGDSRMPLEIEDIFARTQATKEPLKSCGGKLYVITPQRKVRWIKGKSQLFAWLHENHDVKWASINGAVKEDAFFAYCEANAPQFEAIESVPHFPPVPGIHYIHPPIDRGGDGSELKKLLDMLKAKTLQDRQLIIAALCSLFWPGAGVKPAFAVTIDNNSATGQGGGKSFFASKVCGWLCSSIHDHGEIQVSEAMDGERLLTWLVSPGPKGRLVVWDNFKGGRAGGQLLEAMVTSPVLSGHVLFHGLQRVPNRFLYMFTGNAFAASKDMAGRIVHIELEHFGSYKPGGEFAIHELDRVALWGDIREIIMSPGKTLTKYTRRPDWDEAILSKLEDPDKLVELIGARAENLDCETEEAADVRWLFEELYKANNRFSHEVVYFNSRDLFRAFEELDVLPNFVRSTSKLSRWLTKLGIKELEKPSGTSRRGFIWRPADAYKNAAVDYSLSDGCKLPEDNSGFDNLG